jgi:hypothetical protein
MMFVGVGCVSDRGPHDRHPWKNPTPCLKNRKTNRAIRIAGLVPVTTTGSGQPHDPVRKVATAACTAEAHSAPAGCKIVAVPTGGCTNVSAPTALDS